MQKLREFLENGKWKQMKKSDWIVLALVGVLLLVIAMPAGDGKKVESGGGAPSAGSSGSRSGSGTDQGKDAPSSGAPSGDREKDEASGEMSTAGRREEYVNELEEKLESVLSQVEGAGKVDVMITVADAGESVVEKDSTRNTTTTQETDSSGGNRTVTEAETGSGTVYVETGEEKYPYVRKETAPTIVGVVVVAEGAGNSAVVSDISEAIKALFPIEAHRIKVVKMCSREEST